MCHHTNVDKTTGGRPTHRREEEFLMNVTAVSAATSSHYADTIRAAVAARAAQSKATGPVDSDGDHDGSSASGNRLDVTA
jgi:hypothetical protein